MRVMRSLLLVALFPAMAAAQSTTQVVVYYTTDAIGSVRAVTKQVNGEWTVVARHDFMPFGEEVAAPPPPSDRRLFTSKERDNETGLDYFEARYLRASAGRFTTVDPFGGHLEDPQSLTAYAYARNNPLRYTDPTGLDFHLNCGERSATCQPVNGGNGALVQGATGANGAFTPTVITSSSLTNPTSGNTAVVNAGGVLITTGAGTSAQKTSQGVFINGTPAADIAGDPKAAGWSSFTFHVNSSDLSHGVLAEGTAAYHGRESDLGALLKRMGAFSYPEEFFGNPFHPGAGNFRFSQGAHPDLFNYGPSPHFLLTPRVPTLGFHVDSKTGPAHIPCAVLGKGCF
jgi:RHS repeat-associated protein